MGDAKQFTLAVVKGPSRGKLIQTDRKRIAVGTASDNDLVLSDQSLAPRHFLVLIDGARWRIHTLSADQSIQVDSRWKHPENGAPGAVIYAGQEQILLFPGPLEATVIKREAASRAEAAGEKGKDLRHITTAPMEFEAQDLGIPTVAIPVPRAEDPELVKLSQMATVSGDRPPDDLRQTARARLAEERTPVAPSVLKESVKNQPVLLDPATLPTPGREERTVGVVWVDGQPRPKDDSLLPPPDASDVREGRRSSKGESAWDRARRRTQDLPADPARSVLPEIVPEPEAVMPGAERSVMSARPVDTHPTPVVVSSDAPRASRNDAKNAWGDPVARTPDKKDGPRASDPGVNAWGDRSGRRAEPKRAEAPAEPGRSAWDRAAARSSGGNAWKDVADRAAPEPRPERPAEPRGPTGAPQQVSLESLQARPHDPALALLHEPDGDFATEIRVFTTKLDEMMRTLSYRAYMLTSAEPLTGKTTTALNLALALAEDTHRRVALIEANFRYPRLAEITGLPEDEGIVSLIEGRAQVQEALFKINDRNLVLAPAGGRHARPAELISSPRFKALIAELANTVDLCLVDAPSILPFPDANLILPLVDGAFLVVAELCTRGSWVAQATSQLGDSRVLGAIYNRMPRATVRALKKDRAERMRLRA